MVRRSPVIVITGTPGTGKSTHAELLVRESPIPLQHVNVGELVKTHGLHEGFDEEWQSYTVDEDKVRCRSFGRLAISFFFFFASLCSSSFRSSDSDGLTKTRVFVGVIHSFWTNWNRSCLRAGSSSIGIRATSTLSAGPTWSSSYGAITPHSGTD